MDAAGKGTSTTKMDHSSYLRLYCRLCGRRSISASPTQTLNPIEDFRSILQTLHDINVAEESAELFPKFACHDCACKFSREPGDGGKKCLYGLVESAHVNTATNPDGLKKLAREHPVADFWSHSSISCQICEDPNYTAEYGHEQEAEKMMKLISKFSKPGRIIEEATESPQKTNQVFKALQSRLATLRSRTVEHRVTVFAMVVRALRADKSTAEVIAALDDYGITYSHVMKPETPQDDDTEKDSKSLLEPLKQLSTQEIVDVLATVVKGDVVSGFAGSYLPAGIVLDERNPKLSSSPARGGKTNKQQKRQRSSTEGQVVAEAGEGRISTSSRTSEVGTEEKAKKQRLEVSSSPAKNLAIDSTKRRLTPQELEAKKKRFHAILPLNRTSRTDTVRYLLQEASGEKTTMLTRVGITFDAAAGDYLCERGFAPPNMTLYEKELTTLVDVQWAVIMAEVIFKLAHPKDVFGLTQIGVTIDPKNPKVPTWLRIRHEMNRFIASNFRLSSDSAPSLCAHLVKTLQLKAIPAHIKAVEAALECDILQAEAFVVHGLKEPEKIKPTNGKVKRDDSPEVIDLDDVQPLRKRSVIKIPLTRVGAGKVTPVPISTAAPRGTPVIKRAGPKSKMTPPKTPPNRSLKTTPVSLTSSGERPRRSSAVRKKYVDVDCSDEDGGNAGGDFSSEDDPLFTPTPSSGEESDSGTTAAVKKAKMRRPMSGGRGRRKEDEDDVKEEFVSY